MGHYFFVEVMMESLEKLLPEDIFTNSTLPPEEDDTINVEENTINGTVDTPTDPVQIEEPAIRKRHTYYFTPDDFRPIIRLYN